MQEMLNKHGRLGAIFDRTVMIKSSYESFRKHNFCGYITHCADTGWGVLDANVETSTLVLNKYSSNSEGVYFDIQKLSPENKQQVLIADIERCKQINNTKIKDVYYCQSIDFNTLPNSIIGYYFDKHILKLFKYKSLEARNYIARKGNDFVSFKHPRLFYEITSNRNFSHFYNGGGFTQFYIINRDVVFWNEEIIRADKQTNIRNLHLQQKCGVGFGKRGEILDAHILKNAFFFSAEGLAIPALTRQESLICNSFLNSVYSQYVINLYCEQHKGNGYVNMLPMPEFNTNIADIESLIEQIVHIKRFWFSLDETNLEYRGLIAQLDLSFDISNTFDILQSNLTRD